MKLLSILGTVLGLFISMGTLITVTVPAPMEGLTAEAVAKITDIITSETDFTMDQITIIEIKQ